MSYCINPADLSDPSNFQIQVSGSELQTAIAALQQQMSSFSTASFLPTTGPATFTGNLDVQSLKMSHVLLTPYLLAPEQNIELCIRNYFNCGGLSVSNATGQVYFPTGITTGQLLSRKTTFRRAICFLTTISG